jgi:hypothetical protein
MQGSSGGASSLLYNAAVTVRFLTLSLLLYSRLTSGGGGLEFCLAPERRELRRYRPFSGSDFRLADKTAVQFFVALRGR